MLSLTQNESHVISSLCWQQGDSIAVTFSSDLRNPSRKYTTLSYRRGNDQYLFILWNIQKCTLLLCSAMNVIAVTITAHFIRNNMVSLQWYTPMYMNRPGENANTSQFNCRIFQFQNSLSSQIFLCSYSRFYSISFDRSNFRPVPPCVHVTPILPFFYITK